jgi:hypothetical protein
MKAEARSIGAGFASSPGIESAIDIGFLPQQLQRKDKRNPSSQGSA